MENSLQGERPLLKQFFIVVTPVEVCNHGPEGSELHKRMKYCYGYLLSIIPSSLGLKVALNYGYSHSVVSSALFRVFSVHTHQWDALALLPCPVHLASWPLCPPIPCSVVLLSLAVARPARSSGERAF